MPQIINPDVPPLTEFHSKNTTGRSPIVNLENGIARSERVFDLPWDERLEAANAMVGNSVVKGGYLSREIPMWDPDFVGVREKGVLNRWVWATKVRAEGYGKFRVDDFTRCGSYDFARLSVQFDTLPYDILSDEDMATLGYVDDKGHPDESFLMRYVTKLPNPGVEYLTLDRGVFRFAEGPAKNEPLQAGPGKIIASADFVLRWELVPSEAVPFSLVNPNIVDGAMDTMGGTINSLTFAGQSSGQLLYLGSRLTPLTSPFGQRLWTVEHQFKRKRAGEEFFRLFFLKDTKEILPGKPTFLMGFAEASTDGLPHAVTVDGVHLFNAMDHNMLFRVP